MSTFHFYHPIEVRYGDLDPQGHLNNAKYLTYLEQARIKYVRSLGLWQSDSFLNLGMILADIQITFRAPILFGQDVQIGVRVSHLGNKSMKMVHRMEDGANGAVFAEATSILVAYDYQTGNTIPIPHEWRERISEYEGLSERADP